MHTDTKAPRNVPDSAHIVPTNKSCDVYILDVLSADMVESGTSSDPKGLFKIITPVKAKKKPMPSHFDNFSPNIKYPYKLHTIGDS